MPPTAYYATGKTLETDTKTLLTQYLEHIRTNYALNTYNNERYNLVPFVAALGWPDVTDIPLYDLDIAIQKHTQTWKKSSVSTFKKHLRSFLKWCIGYKEMTLRFDPSLIESKKIRPGKHRVFTTEEIQMVLNGCKELQDSLVISLMFATGMRISEVINLRGEDISLLQIRVRSKGENDRVVHLPPALSRELRQYRVNRGSVTGFVFRPLQRHKNHPNDRYVSAYAVRDRIEREFLRTLGVKMHPHELRHSFAVNWLLAGGDIRTLQIMLGHENIETTQWYLSLTDNQVGEVYARICNGLFSENISRKSLTERTVLASI